MTAFDPAALETEALRLKGESKYAEAADLLVRIVRERPDWEKGRAFFQLATCLEETGNFEGALASYEMALSHDPTNAIFLESFNALREMCGYRR